MIEVVAIFAERDTVLEDDHQNFLNEGGVHARITPPRGGKGSRVFEMSGYVMSPLRESIGRRRRIYHLVGRSAEVV